MHKPIFLFLVIFLLIQYGCWSDAKNYKNAYVVSRNDTVFIKLKGKRVLMHSSGTYEDSMLIPIPKWEDGRIDARNLPSREGGYKRQGYILIDKNKLTVKLFYENTDDNKLDASTWNGEYRLLKE